MFQRWPTSVSMNRRAEGTRLGASSASPQPLAVEPHTASSDITSLLSPSLLSPHVETCTPRRRSYIFHDSADRLINQIACVHPCTDPYAARYIQLHKPKTRCRALMNYCKTAPRPHVEHIASWAVHRRAHRSTNADKYRRLISTVPNNRIHKAGLRSAHRFPSPRNRLSSPPCKLLTRFTHEVFWCRIRTPRAPSARNVC